MKQIAVSLATRDGSWMVKAKEVAPGLVIHRELGRDNAPTRFWSLTHVASGKKIYGPYRMRKYAVAMATAIAQYADWTQGERAIVTPELGPKVRQAWIDVGGLR